MAHIDANMRCAFTLIARRKRNPDGTSRPVNGRVRKEWRGDSEAFVENLDTILEEEQQRMAALDLDVPGDDVFEFNEDDADSLACKRVRLELLEDRLSDDDKSVLAQESHPLGSIERMLGSTGVTATRPSPPIGLPRPQIGLLKSLLRQKEETSTLSVVMKRKQRKT